VVQSSSLDEADIECLIEGLGLVTPCTQRIDRPIDLLDQPLKKGPDERSGRVPRSRGSLRG
jgi:hypothetical protein